MVMFSDKIQVCLSMCITCYEAANQFGRTQYREKQDDIHNIGKHITHLTRSRIRKLNKPKTRTFPGNCDLPSVGLLYTTIVNVLRQK